MLKQGGAEMEKIKKTYYIDSDIVKKLKIKAVVENKTETEVANEILKEYMEKEGDKYTIKNK